MTAGARPIPRVVLATAAAIAAGCTAVTPPPMMALHAGTRPAPEGATTGMVIVAGAFALFDFGGVGAALRVERQVTGTAAVGGQLSAGYGKEDRSTSARERAAMAADASHLLFDLRGYGRLASTEHDAVAAYGSLGLTAMDTGLISGSVALGGALSYPNDTFVPALGLWVGGSVPLRHGHPFGDEPRLPPPAWWLGAGFAGIVPTDDGAVSIELDGAASADMLVLAASFAGARVYDAGN